MHSRPPPPGTHTLGATGLRVSRIGLGLAALGRPGYLNLGHGADLGDDRSVAALEARAHAVLDEAWEGGVRYFDAARSYGRAESFLSSWLTARGVAPSEVVIGSKWGYTYTAGWRVDADTHEVKDHSLATFERQWGETRHTLGDHLDVYQVHSLTPQSTLFTDTRLLDELSLRRGDGLRLGFSTSGPEQAAVIERALELRVDGERLFDTVQATWNLLETSAAPALAAAHEAGVGVIVKEALANGRLTERNDEVSFGGARRRLGAQADRLDTPLDALALAAVLAQPWADVVLSGAATVQHMRANLRAIDVLWDDAAEEALAPLVEAPEAYWDRRSGMAWT
jgi:aryl-alcohol dehydrogenase-like predicted oxidoreductase